ncbi:MAG: metallophosphoesterase [Myxococcota bacterium]
MLEPTALRRAGRTLFVGDVHGCARELDTLLRSVEPERVVLAGDLFTKGPDPKGVWSIIQDWDAEAVLGNHDALVLEEWRAGRDLPRSTFRWLKRCPWLLEGESWVTVHAGVHPRDWRKTRKRHALHLREWKDSGQYWWDRYGGPHLVIHGHNQRFGLIDRRPYTLGLDTGCVRGGALTGYLLEEDRLVSVPARRDYT